jgi:hypothetical protein
MIMIAHQDPGKNAPIATRSHSIKQPQPIFAVAITIDDYWRRLLATITGDDHTPLATTCGHMIQTICHLDA